MRFLAGFLFFLLTLATVQAQEFDRLYDKSIQPMLSQPLQWVIALPAAAPNLPEAFLGNPAGWAFVPYTSKVAIPTSADRDVWAKFTFAATNTPRSWVIRIPRVTVQKVSLYTMDNGQMWQAESAGNLIAPTAWNRSTRSPSFEVQTSAIEETYFLRFQHHSPITERPQLMSQLDFVEGATRVGTLTGLMFGMFGILIVMCIAAHMLAKNTEFLSLAAFVAAALLVHLVFIGFAGSRLWPDSAQLNQAMPWVVPLLAVAAGSWFFAQASYAKDSNLAIFRLLVLLALANLVLAGVMMFAVNPAYSRVLNAWAAFCVTTVVVSLVLLCLFGRRWNWWLMVGLAPIAGAAFTRVAYNQGLMSHIEQTQVANVLLTQLGLVVLFLALAWRSRSTLLSTERESALGTYEAISGLTQERVVELRLEQMLLRANRLKLGCGVIKLRWLGIKHRNSSLTTEQKNALLAQVGGVLRKVIRDIDTAAVCKDDHFMILVEGPISRQALSSLATQLVTTFLRMSEKINDASAFNFHMAIWQANLVPANKEEVLEALQTRLNQMSFGAKRTVQFVDAPSSDPSDQMEHEQAQRRDELIAKINAIEASPSLHAPLSGLAKKPR